MHAAEHDFTCCLCCLQSLTAISTLFLRSCALQVGGRLGDLMTRGCANLFHAPPREKARGSHINYPYFRSWFEALAFYTSRKALPAASSTTCSSSASSSGSSSKQKVAPLGVWKMPQCPVLFIYGRGGGARKVFFHTDKW
jgi:hypothetical protein